MTQILPNGNFTIQRLMCSKTAAAAVDTAH